MRIRAARSEEKWPADSAFQAAICHSAKKDKSRVSVRLSG
jgi:hypothetical protein